MSAVPRLSVWILAPSDPPPMSNIALSSSASTVVQALTLLIAALAVVASVYAAVLLRRTGKGTVKAAEASANASKTSADAAQRSAALAHVSLSESMAANANAPVEEFFLAELVRKRDALNRRLEIMWSIIYQLAAVMLASHREDWETDLSNESPAKLKLPPIDVDLTIVSKLPSALLDNLAMAAALIARFEAVKATASSEECWQLLRSIALECREGRKWLDKTLGGVMSAEARVTSEIREARNTMAQWRRERREELLANFDIAATTDEPMRTQDAEGKSPTGPTPTPGPDGDSTA